MKPARPAAAEEPIDPLARTYIKVPAQLVVEVFNALPRRSRARAALAKHLKEYETRVEKTSWIEGLYYAAGGQLAFDEFEAQLALAQAKAGTYGEAAAEDLERALRSLTLAAGFERERGELSAALPVRRFKGAVDPASDRRLANPKLGRLRELLDAANRSPIRSIAAPRAAGKGRGNGRK